MQGNMAGNRPASRMEPREIVSSPKGLALIAGLLYLAVAVFGGFAEGFVEPRMYVAGDAAATAGNVVANSGLIRLGVVSDLLDQTLFVFLALSLYILLRHVHHSAARAMVLLVVLAAGIGSLNTLFEFEGLRVTSDTSFEAFGIGGSNALVLLLLDAQHYGLLIAQIFFGLWLVPLGYLAYKSAGMFPRWLGVLLVVGAVCYLADVLAAFLVPDLGSAIHGYVTIPSAVAEISMVLYLLVLGVRAPSPTHRAPIAA